MREKRWGHGQGVPGVHATIFIVSNVDEAMPSDSNGMMIDACKNYLVEHTCLLRQLAEGSADGETLACQHCEATLEQLELDRDLVQHVANELSGAVEAEEGYQRVGNLARNLWPGAGKATSVAASKLQVRCPSCARVVQLAEDSSLTQIECGHCSDSFRLVDVDAAQELGSTDRVMGHFELLEQVGAGSFGVVWRAKDTNLDRTVAIKIPRRDQLSKREIESFLHEARATAALSHPNIVSVYEIGRHDDSVFIVSDFVDGVTLETYIADRLLTANESAELCAKIADALHHAHQQGVVHRDLKPSNIGIDTYQNPHIMDFGLALRGSTEMTMTTDGKILGTPSYMSPEQARGDSNSADRRSDIYSLGVILFQMLTGERPFRGNIRMLLHQIMHDEAPNPLHLNSAIPRDLATICLKCLEKSPDRRYQTAKELKKDFGRYLDGRPIAARPTSPVERGWRWCLRNPLPATLASALLFALITGTAISSWNWLQAEAATLDAKTATKSALESAEQEKLSAKRSQDVLDIVTASFESVTPESGADAQMSARDVLSQSMRNLESSELDNLGRITLLEKLSRCFRVIGEHEDAISAAEQALTLSQDAFGEESERTIGAKHNLAMAFNSAEQYEQSLHVDEEVVSRRRATLGDDHESTLASKANLASTYDSLGQLNEALQLRQKNLKIWIEKRGNEDPKTLTAMYELARSYISLGRTDEAITTYQKVFDLRSAALGPDHPNTLRALASLAQSLEVADRYDDALALYQGAIEAMQQKLGKAHPHTLSVRQDIGSVMYKMGKFEDAFVQLQATLEDARSTLGNHAMVTQSCLTTLGSIALQLGRINEATKLFEENLAYAREKFGDDHPQTLTYMTNLANAYYIAKLPEKALPLLEHSWKENRKLLGDAHKETIMATSSLASVYKLVGKTEKAQEMAQLALELGETHLGENDLFTLSTMNVLGGIYEKLDKNDDAIAIYDRCLKLISIKLGADHPNSITLRGNLARLHEKLDQGEDALRLFKECLELRTAKAPDSWQTHGARMEVGVAYVDAGEIDRGYEYLMEAYEGLQSQRDAMPPKLRENLHRRTLRGLVNASERREEPDDVERWKAELAELNQSTTK